MFTLSDFFDADRCAVDVRASTKEEAIAKLVDLLVATGKVPDRGALVRAVMAREVLAPTGLGSDCAIPHAQTDAVIETSLAAIRLVEPLDFSAPDGTSARLIFLIAGPKDSAALHLRLLSRLARTLCDPAFRETALSAPSASSFAAAVFATDAPENATA